MTDTITVVSLCYQTEKSQYAEPYHFERIPVESVHLIAGHGIQGDRKAGRNPKRQLNIMDRAMLDVMQAQGYDTSPGHMGEQIQLAGLDIIALKRGTCLRLGDTAEIEIHSPRTGCSWFSLIQDKPIEDTVNRLGVLASVRVSGRVMVGDTVTILQSQTSQATS